MTKATTTIPTAEELESLLRQQGFQPGVPRHIDERTRAIDAHLCRRLICPGCRKRRMVYRPFSDGQSYRIVAACQACGAGEEV